MTARLFAIAIAAACSAPVEPGTTTPAPKTGSAAAAPKPKPAPEPEQADGPLAIAVQGSGEIRIADQPVDAPALDTALRAAAARNPDVQVYLQVEKAVSRERVQDLIARAKAAGLRQIAVTDLPPEAVLGVPPSPISLVWKMHVDGDQLRIDYTITNTTDHAITAVDALWKSGASFDDDSVVVRADVRPDAIAFTRAFVAPPPGWKVEHLDRKSPHYAEIAANGELSGTAHVKLPLGAAHNFAGSTAITGARTRAVFEIGFFEAPDKHEPFKLLRGAVKSLPRGARLASPQEQVDHGWNVALPAH